MFICFAAALSAAETWLPPICPIPGVRVGLGNIVTMFVLYVGGRWNKCDAVVTAVLRCVLAGLITGSPTRILYGIAGGILSAAAMIAMQRLLPQENREKYLPFVGAAGAVMHIAGQLAVAVVIYSSAAVLAYFPVLLSSAIIGGVFTGVCAMLLLKKLPQTALKQVRLLNE